MTASRLAGTTIAILLNLLVACGGNSYPAGPVTSTNAYPRILEKARKDKKYVVMYSGVNVYNVQSVEVDKIKQHMTVQLDKIDSIQLSYKTASDTVSRKPANGQPAALSKILLYMKDSTSYTLDEPHTIPLANLGRIEFQH
jgi:hypothetical protein